MPFPNDTMPWRQEDREMALPQGQGAMLNPTPGTIEGFPLPPQEPDQAELQRQALLQQMGGGGPAF